MYNGGHMLNEEEPMRAVISQMPKHWMEERKHSEAAQWDEMWNGVLHMPPMPNRLHQNVALDLAVYLKNHWVRISGGRVHQGVLPDSDGWLHSLATGVEFRQTRPGKFWARLAGNESTAAELPED